MYESPRLASINSINRGYGIGYGLASVGACNVNVNATVNVNAAVNAAAAANAVAVALVISHYTPLGELGPWAREDEAELDEGSIGAVCCVPG